MKRIKLLLVNTCIYSGFFLFSLVGIPALTLVVAAMSLVMSHRRAMRRFRRAISWYGWVIIHVVPFPWIRVKFKSCPGNRSLAPLLFVCNHRSATDPFLMAVLPHECIQVVNKWPMRLPVLGMMARYSGYLSVRELPPEEFFARTGKLAEQGVSIIAFPEGTRAVNRQMGQFHGAVFRLALQARLPIVPLCISGNEIVFPKGSAILRPGTIRMNELKALTYEEYKDMPPFQLKNRVRDLMAAGVAELES